MFDLPKVFDPSLTWSDIGEVASWSDLPVLVKGVLHPADAHEAIEHGVAGVVVRRLRAVGAVFRAAAGLDGLERAELHGGRVVVRALRMLRAKDQLGQRQIINGAERGQVVNGGSVEGGGHGIKGG